MVKKFLLLGVVLIMGLCISTGCSSVQAIEFRVGTASWTGKGKTITKIIGSLDDFRDSDIVEVVEFDKKYDDSFFNDNALLIIAFNTTSGGSEVRDIVVERSGNRIEVELNGVFGTTTVMSGVIVVLEVKKDDVLGVTSINFTTNLPKAR